MRVVGIDYSLTSPCVCVFEGETFSYTQCKFYFLTDNKKYDVDVDNIHGDLHKDYNTEQQRHYNITQWALSLVEDGDKVYIEGYSMGSKGLVFNIAENTGVLKHYMWKRGIDFTAVPPTVIKKYATGKGNANKQAIQDTFEQTVNVYIKKKLMMTDKQWNPSSDIIDSYYICKYGYEQETKS